MKQSLLATLLSFNGGFVDTAGFLGLQGLFTAHVTGNFVTLGATLVFGSHGTFAKLLALPEFILVVALARLAGAAMRVLLSVEALFLLAFFAFAVGFGPFEDSDAPAALVAGLAGVTAMAIQNAVQRVHLASLPPATMMTGNTTQVVLDLVDLWRGPEPERAALVRTRFAHLAQSILCFAASCAIAALLYAWVGFWNLGVAVAVGAACALLGTRDSPPAETHA